MGWWDANIDGDSFAGPGGLEMAPSVGDFVWGDNPADIIEEALDAIAKDFITEWDRPPTKQEIVSGLRFSLRGRDDFPGEI